jgi:hypothetical protein
VAFDDGGALREVIGEQVRRTTSTLATRRKTGNVVITVARTTAP